ncbi:hypothetical protein [Bradyrhizobium sp. CCBAU 25360]|uniref:hypothetical protein n=1 Tax=Bradyrhizobium sp. CCBAU 25360 TaxID=858425 RepID=UPI0023062D0B|nr:hypothetical protein [Bradyrhizobium sp. CCBAU 25360]
MKKLLIAAALGAVIAAPVLAQNYNNNPNNNPTGKPCVAPKNAPPEDGVGTNFLRFVANDPKRSPHDRQKATQALSASGSDRQLAAMALGWDPTGLVRGCPE